ncbi:MAG: hypothetical protein M5R38_02655 [Candidatus Methylomirabilis sp.]|nr:hypothetical protein [Candidatus Methylomirabilis sp.]
MHAFASRARFLAAYSFVLSFFLALVFGHAYGQEQAQIKQLDIKGSRKIDETTIRFKLKTRVGRAVLPGKDQGGRQDGLSVGLLRRCRGGCRGV